MITNWIYQGVNWRVAGSRRTFYSQLAVAMEPRLDYGEVLPDGMKTIYAMDRYSVNCRLEASLLGLCT